MIWLAEFASLRQVVASSTFGDWRASWLTTSDQNAVHSVAVSR